MQTLSPLPSDLPKRRMLVAFTIEADAMGDRVPVFASMPGHVSDQAGMAALVEAAAADCGMSFRRYLQLIAAAAPPPVGEVVRTPRPAHRQARDWKGQFGASLSELRAIAFEYRAENPKSSMIDAYAAALQEARKSAKMGRLPTETAKVAAAQLKQACRRLPTLSTTRGKLDPPK